MIVVIAIAVIAVVTIAHVALGLSIHNRALRDQATRREEEIALLREQLNNEETQRELDARHFRKIASKKIDAALAFLPRAPSIPPPRPPAPRRPGRRRAGRRARRKN